MAIEEKHGITFCQVLAAARRYDQEVRYKHAYSKARAAFREKSISDLDEESVGKLRWFANQWRNRTPPGILPELFAVLVGETQRLSLLRDIALETPDLEESALAEVQVIFNSLCNVQGFGPTGASKFLGILLPKLCVMWDNSIQQAYGERWRNVPRYSHFLQKVRRLALVVVEDAKQNHGVDDPSAYISWKLDISPPFTLATFINHYLWLTITRKEDLQCDCPHE